MITRNINNFTNKTEYLVRIFNYVLTCALHIVTHTSKSIIWWRIVILSATGKQVTNEYASDKPINYLI